MQRVFKCFNHSKKLFSLSGIKISHYLFFVIEKNGISSFSSEYSN